jgi:hypothetical protein
MERKQVRMMFYSHTLKAALNSLQIKNRFLAGDFRHLVNSVADV